MSSASNLIIKQYSSCITSLEFCEKTGLTLHPNKAMYHQTRINGMSYIYIFHI
jgi:hypothetical protein